MKKILAIGASNSRQSINKKFASYVSSRIPDSEVTLMDLNDFEMPLFGVDKEKEMGSPEAVQRFLELLETQDAVVLSLAEHNSNYTAAFKNFLDWVSRVRKDLWMEKPMFLLSTSPGGRGGLNAMGIALKFLPFMKANIVANFSLPRYREHFSEGEGILDTELNEAFEEQLNKFTTYLNPKTKAQHLA